MRCLHVSVVQVDLAIVSRAVLLVSPPLLMPLAGIICFNAGHSRLEEASEPVLAVLADDAQHFAKGTIMLKQIRDPYGPLFCLGVMVPFAKCIKVTPLLTVLVHAS